MQQTKIEGYRPNYPKKLLKGAALTAAVMLTLSPALGCRTHPDPNTTGAIAIPDPTDEPELDGEIMVDESTPEPEPEWMGDVIADPNEP